MRGFHTRGSRSGVGLVDDLAIERLDVVMCWWHLIDEDILNGISIGDDIPVK